MYTELGKILEHGLTGNIKKVRDYAELIVSKYHREDVAFNCKDENQLIAFNFHNKLNNITFGGKPTLDALIYPTFDDFWTAYDKKVGKKSKIEKKWLKLSQKTKEEIMLYIPNYILSQPNKKYRMNPETFLNNDGWENELIFDKLPNVNRQTEQTIRKNLEEVGGDYINQVRGGG